MPKLSSLFIRSSLVWLGLGFLTGALMLTNKGLSFYAPIMGYIGLHIQFVLIGWILNLVMGVAYWMFPRFTPEETGMEVRGYPWAAWTALLAVNGGLVLATIGHWVGEYTWTPMLAYGLYVLGVVFFVVNAWPRVKPHK